MGPIWGRQDPGGPHVGPINFAIWEQLFDILWHSTHSVGLSTQQFIGIVEFTIKFKIRALVREMFFVNNICMKGFQDSKAWYYGAPCRIYNFVNRFRCLLNNIDFCITKTKFYFSGENSILFKPSQVCDRKPSIWGNKNQSCRLPNELVFMLLNKIDTSLLRSRQKWNASVLYGNRFNCMKYNWSIQFSMQMGTHRPGFLS